MNKVILPSLIIAACVLATPCVAADEGAVAVGLQGASVDGNEPKFREDSLGEQAGLTLDSLEYSTVKDRFNLDINARFSTGRSGWLDLEVAGNRWSAGFNTTMITSWSNTSFAADVLPSGTAVGELYPGSTELIPLFGVSSPKTQRLTGQAWVTYRWSGVNRVTLRAGAWRRDGERVPNVGGFSFSDVGTPAFYTAGLETFDSSASWFEIEGVFRAGPVGINVNAGRTSISVDRYNQSPAFGADRFLDFNVWSDAAETDISWVSLDAAWRARKGGIYAAAAWADTSSDPAGGDARVDETGAVIQDGLSLAGGSNDIETVATALGGIWRPARLITLTLAVDTRSSDGDGAVDLFRRDFPVEPTTSTFDEKRVGGTAQVKLGAGPWWVRLRARATSTDLDRDENRDRYEQRVSRTTDRLDTRLDAAVAFGDGWRLSGWFRQLSSDAEIDLHDLWWGYATSDWSSTEGAGGVSLAYRAGGFNASLNATVQSTDIDSDVPYYDPVFDPTVDLLPIQGDTSTSRLFASLLWPLSRGSLWLEAGVLKTEYEFDDTIVPSGFALVDETVTGTVAAVGGDFGAWKNGRISGRLEWTQADDDLDSELLRAFLQADHTFASGFGLFGRWAYWDLSNPLATSDEYTANVFTAGVKATF